MRHVVRTEKPEILGSEVVEGYLAELEGEMYSSAKLQRQSRRASSSAERELLHGVESSLLPMFEQKCAYCERVFTGSGELTCEIDRFRPASVFPELRFEWNNLLPSCGRCNRLKGDRYLARLEDGSLEMLKQGSSEAESGLLDRCFDFPEEQLLLLDSGEVVSLSHEDGAANRGHITIDLLDLNRSELVAARQELLEGLYPALFTS